MRQDTKAVEARKRRAIELHDMGIKGSEIARFLGVERKTVYKYLQGAPEPTGEPSPSLEAWIAQKDAQVRELQHAVGKMEQEILERLRSVWDEAGKGMESNANTAREQAQKAAESVERWAAEITGLHAKDAQVERSLNAQIERITAIEGTCVQVARNYAQDELKGYKTAFVALQREIEQWMERMGIGGPGEAEDYEEHPVVTLLERVDQLQTKAAKQRERIGDIESNLLALMRQVGDHKKLLNQVDILKTMTGVKGAGPATPVPPGYTGAASSIYADPHFLQALGMFGKMGENCASIFEALFQLDTEEWVALVRTLSELRNLIRTGLARLREKKEKEEKAGVFMASSPEAAASATPPAEPPPGPTIFVDPEADVPPEGTEAAKDE